MRMLLPLLAGCGPMNVRVDFTVQNDASYDFDATEACVSLDTIDDIICSPAFEVQSGQSETVYLEFAEYPGARTAAYVNALDFEGDVYETAIQPLDVVGSELFTTIVVTDADCCF